MSLGDPCNPQHGIDWSFSLSNVPAYGTGQIAMVQTGQNIINGSSTGTTYLLDLSFPYAGATVTTDSTLNQIDDSPAFNLSRTTCTKVTDEGNFTDYFMYQPLAGGSSRPGIWIPMETLSWGWSGTATYSTKTSDWAVSKVTNPTLKWNSSPGQFPSWPGRLQDATHPC